ncbi:MAG: phosphocholine cytidylyltransferase family protein [Alphaproteobacteria bacterium]|nr:phosphocholine cytidylyltransferase family protein [Alphaproteobacteria bacterium]
MRAIILAAGRGSRMGSLTEARPKCLTRLAGRRLLDMQCEALTDAGATEIAVVTGYRAELLAQPDLTCFHNPRWETTNMVASLACAGSWLRSGPCIVSYADIFYAPETVRRLSATSTSIAIAYDPDWLASWAGRFADPLSDAETFRLDGTRVVEIGLKPRAVSEVEGQYMGLLRFTPDGWQAAEGLVASLPMPQRDRLDMTSLLRGLIGRGVAIEAVPTAPGWGEIDSPTDLDFYERAIADGRLEIASRLPSRRVPIRNR